MEIHFCSSCNQSIPLPDVESGQAVKHGREYLCSICRHLPRPSDPRPARSITWLFATLFLAALVVILGLVFQEQLFPPAAATGPRVPDNRAVLESLDRLEGRIRDALAEQTRRTAQQLHGTLVAVETRIGEIATRLEKHEAEIARVVNHVSALERSGAQALTKEDLEQLRGSLGGILREVAAVRGAMRSLEPAAPPPVAAPKAAAVDDPAAEESTEAAAVKEFSEMDLWIARLENKDPKERQRAVSALSRFRGPRVEQALVRLLSDWNPEVRRMAAADLGERKSAAAVAALMKILEDGDPGVREAGVQALRKITGRFFGYRSDGSERQRAQALDRWRQFVAALKRKGE